LLRTADGPRPARYSWLDARAASEERGAAVIWSELKSGLKRILPPEIRHFWRRRQIAAIRRRNRGREVAEIFSEIYDRNRWGGSWGSLHSGSGSSASHAEDYGSFVREFISSRDVRAVVDLGCGDYRVGAQLSDTGVVYTGVDIVPALIESNRKLYG